MTSFQDNRGMRATFSPPISNSKNAYVLGAGVAELVALPAGTKFVMFGLPVSVNVWVLEGEDDQVEVAVPASNVTDGTGAMLNPYSREIPTDITHLSLISESDCIVGVEFYTV